jgi:2,4-dienoyl-CoA reductase-like NADH-dependent reductase (Old Yellow Enzyme family)
MSTVSVLPTSPESLTEQAALFSPLTIRSVKIPNRIGVSPMCQYSAEDGFANDWHLVHLGSRAVGGAGLVFVEATAVTPKGRISPGDLGLWKDEHIEPLRRIATFVKGQGAVAGIQLAHAGRKASTARPWEGGQPLTAETGAWETFAPSPIPFAGNFPTPTELTREQIVDLIDAFVAAARRALAAGFDVVEIHAAHGYLINEFLSPLSNHRTDEYGGSFENRTRFLREISEAVRASWPDELPLVVRISATDWVEGGWTADDSVDLARALGPLGVDLMDCSSGGNSPSAAIPVAPNYQVPFAERIRRETGMRTAAVGMITDPHQAEELIRSGAADIVLLAREFLRHPYWPVTAAQALDVPVTAPLQYGRAFAGARSRR